MQISIPLRKERGDLTRQLYSGLREVIFARGFSPSGKLPSTRELSIQLGISRTVVVSAYDQLLAEGFVVGRSGSGTYVAEALYAPEKTPKRNPLRIELSDFGKKAAKAWSQVQLPSRAETHLRYDFAVGVGDIETFPFALWRRLLLRAARQSRVSELDYASPAGHAPLREAIATHLRRSRAVVCEPSQIIVVNGSQQALDLVVRVLLNRGDAVAVENPCYQGMREVLRVAGARTVPVPVDADGLTPSALPQTARAAFVTPSHQFPTGAVLSLERRLALLSWASRANALLIEDDYDGEFQYDGQPLESLQGLDRQGRVIYIGTFSRTMFPALRIGYLVAPPNLVEAFCAAKWLCDRHTATLEQQALSMFIESGAYERYLRRVRRRNASRRQALRDAVKLHFRNRLTIGGDAAGAHLVLWPQARIAENQVAEQARLQGVGVYPIAPYYIGAHSPCGFLAGYARIRENDIREGIRRLSECF